MFWDNVDFLSRASSFLQVTLIILALLIASLQYAKFRIDKRLSFSKEQIQKQKEAEYQTRIEEVKQSSDYLNKVAKIKELESQALSDSRPAFEELQKILT